MGILEVPVLCLPAWLLRWRVLQPMLYATKGTMGTPPATAHFALSRMLHTCHLIPTTDLPAAVAAQMAVERGWAINLGGGFHHAHGRGGSGFCVYSDIALGVDAVRHRHPTRIRRVLIVDLDAHQVQTSQQPRGCGTRIEGVCVWW